MGGETPYRWVALFRDGHAIDQAESHDDSAAFASLVAYIMGTPEDPLKHRLLWFKITNDSQEFTVSFDSDGDAYAMTPAGTLLMTEFKIRVAELLYKREHDHETGLTTYTVGFGGINTCGKLDGKAIVVQPDGEYKLVEDFVANYDMIKI